MKHLRMFENLDMFTRELFGIHTLVNLSIPHKTEDELEKYINNFTECLNNNGRPTILLGKNRNEFSNTEQIVSIEGLITLEEIKKCFPSIGTGWYDSNNIKVEFVDDKGLFLPSPNNRILYLIRENFKIYRPR